MNTNYRLMRPNEEQAVLLLWADVFGTSVEQQRLRFATDPERHANTVVVLSPDGAVVAAAHYRHCMRRDANGQAQLVGEIDPVATHPDARGQGHAGHLLELIIAAMVADGCIWSLIVTSIQGRPLYERYGWQSYPLRALQGTLVQPLPLAPAGFITRHLLLDTPESVDAELEKLAEIYTAAHSTRPLAVVRDLTYWREYLLPRIAYRSAGEGLHIVTVARTDKPATAVGYILVHFYNVGFLVTELAVMSEHPDALDALFDAAAAESLRRNAPGGRLVLPLDEPIRQVASTFFGPTLHDSPDNRLMARALGRADDASVSAIFAAPGVVYMDIDHF